MRIPNRNNCLSPLEQSCSSFSLQCHYRDEVSPCVSILLPTTHFSRTIDDKIPVTFNCFTTKYRKHMECKRD